MLVADLFLRFVAWQSLLMQVLSVEKLSSAFSLKQQNLFQSKTCRPAGIQPSSCSDGQGVYLRPTTNTVLSIISSNSSLINKNGGKLIISSILHNRSINGRLAFQRSRMLLSITSLESIISFSIILRLQSNSWSENGYHGNKQCSMLFMQERKN